MAFNLKTFQTRAGTAAIFVGVMLAGMCWNNGSFFALFTLIHFGCWYEYFRMMTKLNPATEELNLFQTLGILLTGWSMLFWFSPLSFGNGFTLHAIAVWVAVTGIVLILLSFLSRQTKVFHQFAYSVFGLVYISFSLGLLQDLFAFPVRQMPVMISDGSVVNLSQTAVNGSANALLYQYPWIIPAVIIATIWINDTMAYIVGSLIGKNPLSAISPKKTWEGTIGGIVLAVVVVGMVSAKLFPIHNAGFSLTISPYLWYILAAVVAITGTVGDLLESKLKRMAGVKDSGSFMPGHGGFLDRFDSLLLAIPFAWLVLVFL